MGATKVLSRGKSSGRNSSTWPYFNLLCGLGTITILYYTVVTYLVWLSLFSQQVNRKDIFSSLLRKWSALFEVRVIFYARQHFVFIELTLMWNFLAFLNSVEEVSPFEIEMCTCIIICAIMSLTDACVHTVTSKYLFSTYHMLDPECCSEHVGFTCPWTWPSESAYRHSAKRYESKYFIEY